MTWYRFQKQRLYGLAQVLVLSFETVSYLLVLLFVLSYTMSDTGAGCSIGYFEHINSPAQAYYYYWLTPWQYMQWRHECHGKTMKEAKQEFMWLRDQHQLISHSEGNETYFFIDVQTVDIFQRQADKHNWGINISSSSSSNMWCTLSVWPIVSAEWGTEWDL